MQDAHAKLRSEGEQADAFMLRRPRLRTTKEGHLLIKDIYYVQGVTFMVLEDKVTTACEGYALDQSDIEQEQVSECLATLTGLQVYYRNYRVSDNRDNATIEQAFRSYINWISWNMFADPQSQPLAKHCKLSLSIMVNEYHPHTEVLDTMWQDRSKALRGPE